MNAGPRLLLTRPAAQAEDWSRRMAALGVATRSLPLIEIAPAEDVSPARMAWDTLANRRLVMFVSPNAVQHFFAQRPDGVAWPAGTLAATVGPGSAQALVEHGVPPALIVQPPAQADSLDSEHLWPELQRVAGPDWRGHRALLVRGDGGREWLGDRLREAGAEVAAIGVYRRRCPTLDDATRATLDEVFARPADFAWLFSSSEAVGHLRALVAQNAALSPERGTPPDWSAQRAIATHERIAASARELGLGAVVLVRPDAAAVAAACRPWLGSPLESST